MHISRDMEQFGCADEGALDEGMGGPAVAPVLCPCARDSAPVGEVEIGAALVHPD